MRYTEWFLPTVLALLTAGCAVQPLKLPPRALLEDCTATIPASIRTNRDLLSAYLGSKAALDLCNVDKEALRLWYREAAR